MQSLGEILRERIKTMKKGPDKDSSSEDLSKYQCPICKDTRLLFFKINSGHPPQIQPDENFPEDHELTQIEWVKQVDPLNASRWTEKARRCECHERIIRQQRAEKLLSTSNLSPKFRKRTFDAIYYLDPEDFKKADQEMVASMMDQQRKAFQLVWEYCQNWDFHKSQGHGFGLFGDVGTAKTHLLAAKTNFLLEKGVQSVQVNTADLFEEIRSTYEIGEDGKPTGKKRSSQILELLKSCEDLSLDDVGTENPTPWVKEVFYKILNHRYEHEMATSFTTNNTLEELQLHLGKSYRRLIEPCMSRMAMIKGVSFEQLLMRRIR